MVQITDKTKCSGCTACASVCPKQCITMEADFEGFLYPVVNLDICVDCGICNKVCPIETPINVGNSLQKSFVVRTKDKNVLKESTSGGMFTPLANMILQDGGVVCAAAYDGNFIVRHQFLDGQQGWSDRDLAKFRGSKYVQSDVRGCFQYIQKLLKMNRLVVFVGTPCQAYGLKAFLQKEYDNLIVVDLVCHGTPSPQLWERYLKQKVETYRSEIKEICFRSKVYGYHSGGFMQIKFANGKKYLASGRVDDMLRCFFKEIASRPVCYHCPFKTRAHCSDLTLYDCWQYAQLTGRKDDGGGYTNVLVQTTKGRELLEQIYKEIVIDEVETEQAIKGSGIMMEKCPKPHAKRNEFYIGMEQVPLSMHIQRFLPISKRDYLIEYFKRLVYFVPGLRNLRALIKRKRINQ